MFHYLFNFRNKKNLSTEISSDIIKQMNILLKDFNHKLDLRFTEISSQIKEIELSLSSLEKKLLTKDLKDKQALGALYYKIEEKRGSKN